MYPSISHTLPFYLVGYPISCVDGDVGRYVQKKPPSHIYVSKLSLLLRPEISEFPTCFCYGFRSTQGRGAGDDRTTGQTLQKTQFVSSLREAGILLSPI